MVGYLLSCPCHVGFFYPARLAMVGYLLSCPCHVGFFIPLRHGGTIRILYECEVLIFNLSLWSQFGIMRLCRVMLNCDQRDRFEDQYLTLMQDAFLAYL